MGKSGIIKEYCNRRNLPLVETSSSYEKWVDWVGLPTIKPKKEEKMRKYYIKLKNRKGKVKIIICAIQQGGNGGYGMAIRSKEDEHDEVDGSRIAFARAVRGMKHRKPCFVNRPEVTEAIWTLKLSDFKKLMLITSGMTSDFAKGDDLWAYEDSLTQFIKEINDVS